MSEQPLIATHAQQQIAPPGTMTPMERGLSLTAGTALVTNGLRRGGLGGLVQIVAGAYGVLRGATGHCALKQALTPTPFEQRFSAEHDWPISEALSRSVTISRPLDEVRDFLAQPEKVGALLRWVESVESLGPDRTCWTVRAGRSQASMDADQRPNRNARRVAVAHARGHPMAAPRLGASERSGR